MVSCLCGVCVFIRGSSCSFITISFYVFVLCLCAMYEH